MIASFFGQKSSRSPDEEARILRKLSPNECFQSAQHLLGIYIGCALSCRYAIPETLLALDTDSFKHVIESAFARAILQHPALTVGRIDDNTKSPLWVRLDRIDFNNHITWSEPSEDIENPLSDVLEWQVNNPYLNLERQPCWRAVILKYSGTKFMDVVFAWDHSAGDGKSGKIFHDTFLACLNTPESNSITLKNRSFDVPVTTHTPPMDQLIDLPISLGYIVSELSREQFQVGKSDIDCNKTIMNCYAYWPFIFEKGLVAMIRRQFSDAKANPDLDLNLEDAVWDVARTIREGLLAKLSQGTKNDTVGLAKFIGDWPSYFKGLSKTREHAFEVSNLGAIQGRLPVNSNGEAKWSIDGASFAQSSPSFGAALTLNVISTKGGELVITNAWQVGTVDDEFARGVSSDIEMWLNRLGDTGRFKFA
ncbi:hypothetical protein F25303_10246 [Fusarium sp. NRRL 25303]|nr:hypothetical protein F25303_10246 [Fusarium sp. NRRL 25303]